ncbi:MAG TPA: metal ABC transporter permease [Solirubrobacter sp.]|nr:metal ABC transporter permease [Solirubrobacter sp.]
MLSSGIMQRAFLEAIVLGLACGPLGVWILLLRRAYAAESLSHAMLPGLVIAALAGIPLLLGAAGGVLVAAAGIALVARDARAGGDIGVAVVVSGLFGLGGILALSPDTPPRLGELLFGDLLGLTNGDLLAAAALALGVLAALAVAYRPLAATAFARHSARSLGVRPARTDLALLVLLALTTVAAVQGLGNLLLVALILAPAATALNLATRLPAILALAAALAALAGVAGLVVSYQLDIAAGASVALAAVIVASFGLLKPKLDMA